MIQILDRQRPNKERKTHKAWVRVAIVQHERQMDFADYKPLAQFRVMWHAKRYAIQLSQSYSPDTYHAVVIY